MNDQDTKTRTLQTLILGALTSAVLAGLSARAQAQEEVDRPQPGHPVVQPTYPVPHFPMPDPTPLPWHPINREDGGAGPFVEVQPPDFVRYNRNNTVVGTNFWEL